ncbi:hypothetical protein K2X33_04800 [bacterium]|nr:hypothetical protein [bacterium]
MLLRLSFLFVALFTTASQAAHRYPVTGWNFDWDDNIFYMPTQIRLWTSDGEEVGVSTGEFAVIRDKIGKEAPWDKHELRFDRVTGSMRFFGDAASSENVFLKDVLAALQAGGDKWKGPSWDAFVRAMSNKTTARQTSIITARQHAPRTIYNALKELKKLGYIRHLPLVRNIFPVGYPKLDPRFKGTSEDPSEAKTMVMGYLLDQINALPLTDRPMVKNREGTGEAQLHLWGFSDDDYGNYSKAATFLSAEMAKGRWPNMKITIYFTGVHHPTIKPTMAVIQTDGTLREVAAPPVAVCPEAIANK